MNNYQEALDTLDCRVNSTEVECHHCEKQENCSSALAIIELQKLIDKHEKYKWHDLRKDLKDLPQDGEAVIIHFQDYHYKDTFTIYTRGDLTLWVRNKVIAWKYIEEFEDE